MVVLAKHLNRKTRQMIQAELGMEMEKENKYHNRIVKEKGKKVSDSGREYERLKELRLQEKAGLIRALMPQFIFPFIHNGLKVGSYKCDFKYWKREKDRWVLVVEDSKGARTAAYKRNKKCMLAFYGIKILET